MPGASEVAVQLTLLGAEAAIAAAVLLALFSARGVLGLAPIYTTVGVFYYLATLLASSSFVALAPGMLVSPGSVALFPASLFAVLLIYIREDAKEARTMIYGLLAANISASLLGVLVVQQLRHALAVNPFVLPSELFVQSPRLFVVGTLAVFADTVLIILAYEAVSRVVRPMLLRTWISLAAVLAFDTVLFVTGGFFENPAYRQLLFAGIVGKAAAALLYAAALTLYLRHAADEAPASESRLALGALFQVLTYRQKYEALRAQAQRDSLTGVHNRGFFDEALAAHVTGARRSGVPFSVMLIDVDHFKRINDTAGHAEGDRALRVIADALVASARASDIVCRYGGEEFCLLLPGTTREAAAPLAARIGAAVPAACTGARVAAGGPVTVTIGLAAYPEDGVEVDALLRAADRRLYRGKNEGRARVVAA